MSNVRAGIAYVDVKLGEVESLRKGIKAEVEAAAKEAGKKLGEDIAKTAAPGGEKVGKVVAQAMTKSFFKDAQNSMMSGFRALSQFQIQTFGREMINAGKAGINGVISGFKSGVNKIKSVAVSMGNGFVNTFLPAVGRASVAIGSFASAVGTKLQAASKHIDNFGKKMGFLSFQMQTFGVIASTAFTAPIVGAVGFASVIGIKTAAAIENATASLKFLLPAGYDVDKLLKRLQATAQASPIFDTSDLIAYTQKFVAAGVEIGKTERFLKAFSNVALVTGVDSQRAGLAIQAIAQAFGKGKLQAEELTQQLGESMPAAMKLLRESLGVSQSELLAMVKAGKISGEDLINIFTRIGESKQFLDGAAAGASTLTGKWQALKESVQTQLGQVFLENADGIKKAIDDLGPALSDLLKEMAPVFPALIRGFADLVKKLGELVDWYRNLSPSQKDLVNDLIKWSAILGPLVLVLGAFGGAIAGIAAGIAALLTPVGAVVAGVAVIGIGIYQLVGYLKDLYKNSEGFKEKWDATWSAVMTIVKPVVEGLKDAWAGVKDAFNQVKKAFDDNRKSLEPVITLLKVVGGVLLTVVGAAIAGVVGVFVGAIGALGSLFRAIGSIFSGAIKIVSGLLDFFIGLFTGNWDRMAKGLESIWDGLWDAVVGTITNIIQAIINFVSGFVNTIYGFFKWIYDVLVGHSIIPDMVNAILKWFRSLVDRGINFIKDLGRFFLDFYSNYIKPFVDRVIRGGSDLIDWFRELPGRILRALGNAASWLINVGRDIVNGLIEGVRSMGSALARAIVNLIPGPVRSIVENALGINSPSKVFAQIGEYTVLGFIQGVKSLVPQMESEMRAFDDIVPRAGGFAFGDARNPVIEPRGAPKAALNIENYYTNDDDPRRQSEDWYFLITSRGGVA